MWGILLMISAATEGVPFTSIAIRNEFWQDAIGGIGLFLALLGVYLGFSTASAKRKQRTPPSSKSTAVPP
jgi:hypothetical protein